MAPPCSSMMKDTSSLDGPAAQVVCKQTYAYMAFPAQPDGSGGPTLWRPCSVTWPACCLSASQRTGCWLLCRAPPVLGRNERVRSRCGSRCGSRCVCWCGRAPRSAGVSVSPEYWLMWVWKQLMGHGVLQVHGGGGLIRVYLLQRRTVMTVHRCTGVRTEAGGGIVGGAESPPELHGV
jgi:hypothetical protein